MHYQKWVKVRHTYSILILKRSVKLLIQMCEWNYSTIFVAERQKH